MGPAGKNSGQCADGLSTIPCTCHRLILHVEAGAGQEGVVLYTPFSLSLAWSPGHHSGTNAIKPLQSDLLNFSSPLVFTIGKKIRGQSFFYSFWKWKAFSFLLCWSRDCLACAVILKGLSGSHRGERFPCAQSCAMQK